MVITIGIVVITIPQIYLKTEKYERIIKLGENVGKFVDEAVEAKLEGEEHGVFKSKQKK